MKSIKSLLIILLAPFSMIAQSLEIEGAVKITEMDTSNIENLLVVKRSDGTLATRQVASLPPPPGGYNKDFTKRLKVAA
jgi:hypothetical protein